MARPRMPGSPRWLSRGFDVWYVCHKEPRLKTFVRMVRCDCGASAAEYAVILAIVGSGLAVAALTLGRSVDAALNASANQIANCQDGAC